MQFKLRGRTGALLLSALVSFGSLVLIIRSADPALAQTIPKKHPKGFVHDTAGDGTAAPPPITSYNKGGTPKWIQYDWGGLYYYRKNELEKARSYWMESLKEAEQVVPAERARGLSAQTADACCHLIKHLLMFVEDSKFRPHRDTEYGASIDSFKPNSNSTNPAKSRLDGVKDSLKELQQDWDWYERVCNFADRAIGKQRDCMRQIYSQRGIFERKIVQTRQLGQQLEDTLGVDPRFSAIDTRPLKWGGIEGSGNPFDVPDSNPTPLKYRGGLLMRNGPPALPSAQ
jgi:hypothetical protein